jgi:uncharacterized ParB-like nuclease family protein
VIAMSRDIQMPLSIDEIVVGEGRRALNEQAVKKLAASIEEIGLRHPITVRKRADVYYLIAGRHRLEACRKLGREHVPAIIVNMNNSEARKWEIAENLHRADLTKLERDDMLAEWVQLTVERKGGQSAPPGGAQPHDLGIKAASRELGIERTDVKRAVRVGSLSEEAKDAARETGMDDNRSALLEAAGKSTAAEQVATIHRLHTAKVKKPDDVLNDIETKDKQVQALMAAWNRAGKEAREEFLSRIEQPVMDRRFK